MKSEQNNSGVINDFDGVTLENVIKLIKNGDDEFIYELSYDDVKELFVFADKYDIELLKISTLNSLMLKLTMDNSKYAFKFAKQFNLIHVVQYIKEFRNLIKAKNHNQTEISKMIFHIHSFVLEKNLDSNKEGKHYIYQINKHNKHPQMNSFCMESYENMILGMESIMLL